MKVRYFIVPHNFIAEEAANKGKLNLTLTAPYYETKEKALEFLIDFNKEYGNPLCIWEIREIYSQGF